MTAADPLATRATRDTTDGPVASKRTACLNGPAAWRAAGPALAFAATAALVLYRLAAQMAAGPGWDSFVYLDNAATFAGRIAGYTEYGRPPLLSLIAAVPLLLGFHNVGVIQAVDAGLSLAGLLAFYLLARRRFGRTTSSLMTLALLMTPPLWLWLGIGMTDFAAVGLWLWALYFAIRGTEIDCRWFLATIPMLLCAILMKTTSVLFILPLFVWLLLRARPFRQARALASAGMLAIAVYVPFAIYYATRTGDPLFLFVDSLRIREAAASAAPFAGAASLPLGAASPFVEFDSYLRSLPVLLMPSSMGPVAIILLALVVAGCVSGAAASVHARGVRTLAMALAVVAGVIAALTAALSGFPVSQAATSLGVALVWYLLASRPLTGRAGRARVVPAAWALDAVMAASVLGPFVFFETWGMRGGRYFLTMAPGIVYFMALGIRALLRAAARTQASVPEWTALRFAPAVALIAALGILTTGLAIDVAGTSWTRDTLVDEAAATAAWISARGGNAAAVTYSDIYPYTGWFLDSPVRALPTFDTMAAVAHELRKNRASYFVTRREAAVPGYRVAWSSGATRVLVPTASTAPRQASVQLLGTGWENYIEELTGYSFALVHDEGPADAQGSAFLDAYPAQRLAAFPVVAVFGAKWRDRSLADRILADYVNGGGTLVIDASRNLDVPYSQVDSALFAMTVAPGRVPTHAAISVAPAFAARHPEIGAVEASPFVDEGGGPWSGARYSPLPGAVPPQVLAAIDGRPLALESTWGRGRIIWIAYNFAWHAHLSKNPGEKRLLRALFDEALDR